MTTDSTLSMGLLTYFRGADLWVTPQDATASMAAFGVEGSVPDLQKLGVSRASFAASHWRGKDKRAEVVAKDKASKTIEIGLLRREQISPTEVGWVQYDSVTWTEGIGWTGGTTQDAAEFIIYGVKWQENLDYHWVRYVVFYTLKKIGIPMGGGGITYVHSDTFDKYEILQNWIKTIRGATLYSIKIDPTDDGSRDAVGGAAKDHALGQVDDVLERLESWREKAKGRTSTLETLLQELTEIRGRAVALSTVLRFSTDEVDAAVASAEESLQEALTNAEATPSPKKASPSKAELMAEVERLRAMVAATNEPAAPAESPEVGTPEIPSVEALETMDSKDLRKLCHALGLKGFARQSETVMVSRILELREG